MRNRRNIPTLVILLSLFSVLILPQSAEAAWNLEDSGIVIKEASALGPTIPKGFNKNQDCRPNYEIVTYRLLAVNILSHQQCVIQTAFGVVAGNGYIVRNGTIVGGRLSGKISPIVAPNGNHLLARSGGNNYSGHGLAKYSNVRQNLETTKNFASGSVTHKLTSAPTPFPASEPGSPVKVLLPTISFSGNGQWFLAKANDNFVRANMDTGEPFFFGKNFSYTPGNARIKTAVSSDGKYAITGSGYHRMLTLHDLSNCTALEDNYHDCASINLVSEIKRLYPDFFTVEYARFRNAEVLEVSFIHGSTGEYKWQTVTMASSDAADYGLDYMALGDSYASGEGAFEYKPSTDVGGNKCHVSVASYPFLIGQSLNLESYESVACSGAEVEDVWTKNTRDYLGQFNKKPQEDRSFSATNNIEINFLPGYLNQSTFLETHKPKHITVSAGGNDIGFGGIIARCISSGTCYEHREDRIELVNEVRSQIPRLEAMYTALRSQGHYDSSVYAIGYPQVAKPDGVCKPNVMLNQDELIFAENLIAYLNKTIQVAAERAGVYYVDVEGAFVGARLCEYYEHPAVYGITAGNDRPGFLNGPIGNESYHPTKLGHQLYSHHIKTRTNNFSVDMPEANPEAWYDDDTMALNLYANTPLSDENRQIRKTTHDSEISDDHLIYGLDIGVRAGNPLYTLKPNEPYEVWVYSEPTLLGTVNTDENGVIDDSVSVPSTIPVGYHTLKIIGNDVTEEPVSIHKTVFVAESLESIQPPQEEEEVYLCADGSEMPEDGVCEEQTVDSPNLTPSPLPEQKPPLDNPETVAGNEEVNIPPPEADSRENDISTDDSSSQTRTTENPQTTAPSAALSQTSAMAGDTQERDATGHVAGVSSHNQPTNAYEPKVLAKTDTDTPRQSGTQTLLIILGLLLTSGVIALSARKMISRN